MRRVATCRSAASNVSEEKAYFINPCCFGDDLAKWMILRLAQRGVRTDPEPGQEDFGWYFDFEVPAGEHCCILGFRPDDPEGTWVLTLERSRGLLGSVFLGRSRGIAQEAARTIHDTLAGADEIKELRWHEDS